ncbi:MAG: hypothetical protein SVN78_01620 [Deferribacterota bacterium]|nr:hypothetical protein [Deferribacterota bacterium]
MKKRFFQVLILGLFLSLSTPAISYSLNVHSQNVQRENIPVLKSTNANTQKDMDKLNINRGQIRSRMVHIRNNIRQFFERLDIFNLF